MPAATLRIIRNADVIAVNQDWGGSQGRMIRDHGTSETWAKPMSDGSVAVVLLNRAGTTATISTSAAELGLSGSSSYRLRDLWTGATSSTTGGITAAVAAHGVVMYRVSRAGSLAAPPAAGTHRAGHMTWQAATLELRVIDGRNGNAYDHADWGAATITCG